MTLRLRAYQRRPLWWLGLLLGVWMSAQTLAFAHRAVHGGAGDHFHAGHAQADCQLYDQAGTADAIAGLPLLALPEAVAPAPLAAPVPAPWAPAPPPFHARGPPALR